MNGYGIRYLLTCTYNNSLDKSSIASLALKYFCSTKYNMLTMFVIVELRWVVSWNGHLKRSCFISAQVLLSEDILFWVRSNYYLFFDWLTFVIGIDSPVSIDSSTTQVPSTNMESHSITNPPSVGKKITSLGTSSKDDISLAKGKDKQISLNFVTNYITFRNTFYLNKGCLIDLFLPVPLRNTVTFDSDFIVSRKLRLC